MIYNIYIKKSENKKKYKINFSNLLNKNIKIYFEYILNKKNPLIYLNKIKFINSYKKYKKYYKLITSKYLNNIYIRENLFNKILYIKKNIKSLNLIIPKYTILSLLHKNCFTQYTFTNNTINTLNLSNIYYIYIKNSCLYNYWNNLFLFKNSKYSILFKERKRNTINYFNLIKDITSGLILIEYIFESKKLNNKYLISPTLSILINTCISYETNISKYFWFYNIYSFQNHKLILISEISNNNIFNNNNFENKSSILMPNNIIIFNTYSINILIFKLFLNNMKYNNQEYSAKTSFIYAFNLLVESLIKQYLKNGIIIPSIQFELIVKKMTTFVKINYTAESCLTENEIIEFNKINNLNYVYKILTYKQILYFPIILGITKATLANSGLLSSISFQDIIKYLIKLSIKVQNDWLTDFKSKIITTDLMKTGSGWYRHFIKI